MTFQMPTKFEYHRTIDAAKRFKILLRFHTLLYCCKCLMDEVYSIVGLHDKPPGSETQVGYKMNEK